jgi:hypothetical protein
MDTQSTHSIYENTIFAHWALWHITKSDNLIYGLFLALFFSIGLPVFQFLFQ